MPKPSSGVDNLLGVRPVDSDTDGTLLQQAITEHKDNFNLQGHEGSMITIDNVIYEKHRPFFDPVYQQAIEHSHIPAVIRCGWHDAGTQLGALSMFASFDAPLHIIIDPWNHTGDSQADPLTQGDGTIADTRPMEDLWASTAMLIDHYCSVDGSDKVSQDSPRRVIDYYTLGDNRWRQTTQWPLPETQRQRWYTAADHQLTLQPPASEQGSDTYHVDDTASTGRDNRWFAQARHKPILFPDRQEADKKLLVYDTPPLEQDTEITGHPVVSLQLRTSATDGQFFAYLETVDPDGRVRLLTEGQLRGLHRKISDETPPYKMFGPYHSLLKKDAQLMVPGEVTEISFDLFPISVLLKQGQRIRLAIAGADSDVFAPIPGCERPTLNIERNAVYASYIDLPIIERAEHA